MLKYVEYKVDPSTYTVALTSNNGFTITFNTTTGYNVFQNYLQNFKRFPIIRFRDPNYQYELMGSPTYNRTTVNIHNYVTNDANLTIYCIFYLNSDGWGTSMVNKTLQLYFLLPTDE